MFRDIKIYLLAVGWKPVMALDTRIYSQGMDCEFVSELDGFVL